jgi:hypothetical protein
LAIDPEMGERLVALEAKEQALAFHPGLFLPR